MTFNHKIILKNRRGFILTVTKYCSLISLCGRAAGGIVVRAAWSLQLVCGNGSVVTAAAVSGAGRCIVAKAARSPPLRVARPAALAACERLVQVLHALQQLVRGRRRPLALHKIGN